MKDQHETKNAKHSFASMSARHQRNISPPSMRDSGQEDIAHQRKRELAIKPVKKGNGTSRQLRFDRAEHDGSDHLL